MTVSHAPATVRHDYYNEAFALSDAIFGVLSCYVVLLAG